MKRLYNTAMFYPLNILKRPIVLFPWFKSSESKGCTTLQCSTLQTFWKDPLSFIYYKKSSGKTLLRRAVDSKAEERKYVSNVLNTNGCSKTFLRNCRKPVTTSGTPDERQPAIGFAVIPYIQGVTQPVMRILNTHNVKVSQRPFQTLRHIFAKPKDAVTKEQPTDDIYSIPCNDCDMYIGQIKRQSGTRLKEHLHLFRKKSS